MKSVGSKQNKTKQQHSFALFHWCKTLHSLANHSSTPRKQATSLALQGVKQFGIVVFAACFVLFKLQTLLQASLYELTLQGVKHFRVTVFTSFVFLIPSAFSL